MIEELVYVLLAITLMIISFKLNKDLEHEYYQDDVPQLGIGKFFFVALIFPWNYFKRGKVFQGWLIYLFMCMTLGIALYLIFKSWGLSKF